MSVARQFSLFDRPAEPTPDLEPVSDPSGEEDVPYDMEPEQTGGARPYQVEAVSKIRAELSENRSTLCVMATGTGKTRVFAEVIKGWKGSCLVIAHRDELLQQAMKRLEEHCGERVELEQAGFHASLARITVASIQTLSQPRRLEGWSRDQFGLIVVDEAHHAPSVTYKRVLGHFSAAKVLGVTATPDRADRLAMGAIFDSVAYLYEISDAIRDGWLCPLRVHPVHVDQVDLSGVKTTAGDLNEKDLDERMGSSEALHAVAKPTIELAGDRRTLVFTTGVATAHALADTFNGYRPGCARAVDGGTERMLRRQLLAEHQAGSYQFLVNVGIATEGYDDPGLSCVAMGRPTKSRALYTQCIGRGTRKAEGKEDLLVLDFTPNSGRHRLVSGLDVLAGRYPDDVVEKAKRMVAKQPGMLAAEALATAEEAIVDARRRDEAKRARVAYRVSQIDPFQALGVADPGHDWHQQFGVKPATEKQLKRLDAWKIPIPTDCSRAQASALIGKVIERMDRGLCTWRQADVLRKRGYDTTAMPRSTASALMDALAKNGWKNLAAHDSNRILSGAQPEPGWNG